MTPQNTTRSLRGAAARTVEVYDFRRPTTLAREHSRALEVAFETFARQWGTQLTAKVRVKSQVTSEQVMMQTYDEYAASLPATTAMVMLKLEGFDSSAVVQFPTSSALSWVARMLGGNGSLPAPDRKFTQLEQALVKRLMEDALEDLRYSLGPLLPTAVSLNSIHYNSQFAQAAAPNDLMVVSQFAILVGENRATATVALPAELLMPQLGAANPTTSLEEAPGLLRRQMSSVPVDVSIGLVPSAVRPEAILNLTVGDLVRTKHPSQRPLEVTVAGQRIAQAALGKNGPRLAARITDIEENRA
ncbi:flagellar motor switch protein FliM [Crystallibacter crystallopoietes]|uniref:flagellar motor switch protein FliM n=1 Tax=Crystallibacter crystallopoietes TaxID=37928 RepID=UPI0006973F4C|nr:flagellar motor switch protein FliM [Arthrobacter crystallopoietes]